MVGEEEEEKRIARGFGHEKYQKCVNLPDCCNGDEKGNQRQPTNKKTRCKKKSSKIWQSKIKVFNRSFFLFFFFLLCVSSGENRLDVTRHWQFCWPTVDCLVWRLVPFAGTTRAPDVGVCVCDSLQRHATRGGQNERRKRTFSLTPPHTHTQCVCLSFYLFICRLNACVYSIISSRTADNDTQRYAEMAAISVIPRCKTFRFLSPSDLLF